jgi:hypothetical protein
MALQSTYLLILVFCLAGFATAATVTYTTLKNKDVKTNKSLDTMRNLALTQMIIGWSTIAFLLFMRYRYHNTGIIILGDQSKVTGAVNLAYIILFITGAAFLGSYGSLENTNFSDDKTIENNDGKENKNATNSILASMVLNFLFIFIFTIGVILRPAVVFSLELTTSKPRYQPLWS